jgi:hypothetical protein
MSEIVIPLSELVNLAYGPYGLAARLKTNPDSMSDRPALMHAKRLCKLSEFTLVATTDNLNMRDWALSSFRANDYSTFSGLRSIILEHKHLNYRVVACAGTYKMADVCNDLMFLAHLKTFQESALARFVRRHWVSAKPHIFVGHSLGGYLSMCGAALFRANYITINPGYGRRLDLGVAKGIHLLSERDLVAGSVRGRLPGVVRRIPGAGNTHSPEFHGIDAYVSVCAQLTRDPSFIGPN